MTTRSLACFLVLLMTSISYGEITPIFSPDNVRLIYDSTNGNFQAFSPEPLTTFELKSDAGIFTGLCGAEINGLFDVCTERKIFKLEPSGFDSLNLPGAFKPGLSFGELYADLNLGGSFAAGGSITGTFIPEPSGLSMIAFALLGVLRFRCAA